MKNLSIKLLGKYKNKKDGYVYFVTGSFSDEVCLERYDEWSITDTIKPEDFYKVYERFYVQEELFII